jgi:hypothetical protein
MVSLQLARKLVVWARDIETTRQLLDGERPRRDTVPSTSNDTDGYLGGSVLCVVLCIGIEGF